MAKLVTIFGGSGFLGRYIARRMANQGWRVRVAVRRPNEAIFVRTYGTVGQVVPVLANIRDDASVAAAIGGADAVINCVGTFDMSGRNNFDAVQVEGAGRVARLTAEAGIDRLVHISAIGADILRPSVMFGTEDAFFNRFARMTKFGPVLPLVGGQTRFQPVYVDDVAHAAQMGVTGKAAPGIYELGGPDVGTLRSFIELMLRLIRRRRLVMNMPFWMGSVMAWGLNAAQVMTGGLFHNSILTRDQVRQLRQDNVVSEDAKGFDDLGLQPTDMEAVLDDYLWVYRPGGQYSDLHATAPRRWHLRSARAGSMPTFRPARATCATLRYRRSPAGPARGSPGRSRKA